MPLGPYPAGHLKAVQLGKAEIQDDQVHTAAERPLQRLRAVRAYFDGVPSRRSARARGSEMDVSSSASSTEVMNRSYDHS